MRVISEFCPRMALMLVAGLLSTLPGWAQTIRKGLNQEINEVLARPEIRQRAFDNGAVIRPMSPDQFSDFVIAENRKYGDIVKRTSVPVMATAGAWDTVFPIHKSASSVPSDAFANPRPPRNRL